jgi:hypothetical protein
VIPKVRVENGRVETRPNVDLLQGKNPNRAALSDICLGSHSGIDEPLEAISIHAPASRNGNVLFAVYAERGWGRDDTAVHLVFPQKITGF